MEVLTALSQFAQIARMEIVEMMPVACVKLDGKETLAMKRPVKVAVNPMEESATMETVFALLDL